MSKSVLLLALAVGVGVSAQTPSSAPIIDNDRVTVWDVAAAQGMAGGEAAVKAAETRDSVVIYMLPEAVQGKADFVPRGMALRETLRRSGASRMAVLALKDKPPPVIPNPSGLPEAFPRPRSKKVLENPRVIVWDYTFERDDPSPMHFHSTDVVTVYLKDGALISTTPDGKKTDNAFSAGTIRFNPANRMHTEMLVKGASRIMATELK